MNRFAFCAAIAPISGIFIQFGALVVVRNPEDVMTIVGPEYSVTVERERVRIVT